MVYNDAGPNQADVTVQVQTGLSKTKPSCCTFSAPSKCANKCNAVMPIFAQRQYSIYDIEYRAKSQLCAKNLAQKPTYAAHHTNFWV